MTHTAELIAVGTELLLGNIANTNAQFLSQELSTLGINVFYHTVVGDNPDRLKQAVEIARKRADIIITTGGLGPTYDDLTKQTLAEAFGKQLVYHEEIAAKLEAYAERLGRKLTPNNYQQCYLPEGCLELANTRGTAPGCAIEGEDCLVIMLPGPPAECQNMFLGQAMPLLKKMADGIIASRTLRVYGLGESAVETLILEHLGPLTNPTLAPYAKVGEVELRITAKADTQEQALQLIAPVEAKVRDLLGDLIYGIDQDSLESVCLTLLEQAQLTFGTAESCTGGLVAKRLTDLPGASTVFQGSIVSYTNQIKARLLGVPDDLLLDYTPVSQPVANAMAIGARETLQCDLAIATTGVAGPGSDEYGNPPGLVYVALATETDCFVRELRAGFLSREQVRMAAAHCAFDMVRRYLTHLPVVPE